MNELKPQTPLTDAYFMVDVFDHPSTNVSLNKAKDFARSLELKLQEAERQRDEAKDLKTILPIHGCLTGDCPHGNANQCVEALKEYVVQMEQAELELQSERDQLIKVVDELAQFGEGLNDSLDDYLHLLAGHDRTCDCDRCETWRAYIKALAAYSLLPHVQAKKGNKQ